MSSVRKCEFCGFEIAGLAHGMAFSACPHCGETPHLADPELDGGLVVVDDEPVPIVAVGSNPPARPARSYLGIAVGFSVFAAGFVAFVIWQALYTSSSFKDDLKLLPDDCDLVAVMNPTALDRSTLLRQLRAANPGLLQYENPMFGASMPVQLYEFDRAALGLRVDTETRVGVMRTSRQITESDIAPYNAGGETVGNHHFIHLNGYASCLLNSRGFVVGKQGDLVKALDRNGPPRMSPDLQAALGHVDPERGISAAIALSGLQRFPLDANIRAAIRAIAVNVELADDVKAEATIICHDRAAADFVAEKIKSAQFGNEDAAISRAVRTIMDTLEIQKTDAIVQVKLQLNSETAMVLVNTIKELIAGEEAAKEAP